MRRVALAALCGCLVIALSGCATKMDPFEKMQRQAMAIRANGGLAAAGTGLGRTKSMANSKAQLRARTELARMIETRVQSLQKDFREEIGTGKDAEYNELFSDATKNLVNIKLRGSALKDIGYTSEDEQIRACALMVQDPKLIADYFKRDGNNYTRFRASQAFSELDADVKKYEEWKLKEKAILMSK